MCGTEKDALSRTDLSIDQNHRNDHLAHHQKYNSQTHKHTAQKKEQDRNLARCLNPHANGGHENPDGTLRCHYCDFLVQGARIGIYEVLSFVGAGSYGYVYQVREPNPLGRILALKVLRQDQFNSKAQANFFQEARRIASMQHPNILPVYNFGQLAESDQPYFVMEYAPDTIMDHFLNPDKSRRMAFAEELIPYIQQAASALNYVHDKGLVHQDVKPGNLLLGHNGQILLADFGTTYYLGMQTHAALGEITGTAAYMPPEQWQGLPRRDSDQYALAICCYELLTGRPPFRYKRLDEMWQAHSKEPIPALQRWNPRVPTEVVTVLLRALEKDYHRRYRSVLEFANSYTHAVETAQQRYFCLNCGQQNRTGASRCSYCGVDYDGRRCPHCDMEIRLGQRCCPRCGRLTIPPHMIQENALVGISLKQGRYTITRVLKQSEETRIVVAVATDIQKNGQRVLLKRFECSNSPLTQRASDIAYYDHASEKLARLKHPLIPAILDRFAEGRHYYLVETYIDGESLEERLARTQKPLREGTIASYMNTILNILMALERHTPLIRHYDITPENIIIEAQRDRIWLTGLQITPPPPAQSNSNRGNKRRTTRKLQISPYQPVKDRPFDQRSCIYALAASMHHALTNTAPPHYPGYPLARTLNPDVSNAMENILSRALTEDASARYQNYSELKRSLQALL